MIPGIRSHAWAKRLSAVESPNITYRSKDFPIFWKSARGCRVQDLDGHSYLDLTSAFGVSSLGYGYAPVRRAAEKQLKQLWHGMGDVHPSAIKVHLLKTLHDVTPGKLGVTILGNSGSDAIEAALKTAMLATGKPGVLAFEGAYHGLSYGALGLTDRDDFSKPFRSQLSKQVIRAPYPDLYRGRTDAMCLDTVEKLLRKHRSKLGALIVEPVQGRGGVRIPGRFFLRGLRELTQRYGMVMIADEIWTGFGRSGQDFGVNHSKVVPDVICLGKALTNGFPLSACVGTPTVMSAWPRSRGEAIHTSTFLGNPLGCAMALASIESWKKEKLTERSERLGKRWLDRLKRLEDHPNVGEVRGQGLMIGIEFVKSKKTRQPNGALAARITTRALKAGLLVLPSGKEHNVLSLTPPLVISEKDLNQAATILEDVLND